MRFTLYPIYWLADVVDPEPFDCTVLPFDIVEGVRIESIADRFRPGAFDLGAERYGAAIREDLEQVRYAIVHTYEVQPLIHGGEYVNDADLALRSERLVREVTACLRLIRPMRSRALLMRGNIRNEDATFDVRSYDVPPLHLFEVPPVQRLFKLRNQDCHDLTT